MSSILFKRLFEVQLLHDYFLTAADGKSFFDQKKADKAEIIEKKLKHNLYNIKKVFEITPTTESLRKMSEYKLMWSQTALGFLVGTQVKAEKNAGATLYKPCIAFSDDLVLDFSVRPLLPFFDAMTNISLRPPLPFKYYFTNKGKEEFNENMVPNYSSLPISNKVRPHQNGMKYEMGALLDDGGTIKEALQKTDGNTAAHLIAVDDKRYVTDADRILLPHDFTIPLSIDDGITVFNAILEDETATEIKSISKSSPTALASIYLKFRVLDDSDPESDEIPDGFYTLKITAGGGPEVAYPVYLNNNLYNTEGIGVIEIRADEPDSPFSLLDAAGFLKTRISAADEKIPHPIFKIRLDNRKTYWRYVKKGDFTPAEVAATTEHLVHQPEKLISKKPKGLTDTLVPFINGTTKILPHPKVPALRIEGDKIFSEIHINQSNRLLNS